MIVFIYIFTDKRQYIICLRPFVRKQFPFEERFHPLFTINLLYIYKLSSLLTLLQSIIYSIVKLNYSQLKYTNQNL